MAEDELELDTLGDRKSALFVILSDTDSTFNFVAALMYSQLFNLLCDKADDFYGGRLPVHVRCLLDEFANIGQIPNFDKLIATIRSREISASIILQSQSQLKTIYKDAADTIVGNCDSTLFLGGKEKSTLKEISELLGKETIDSFNQSENRGSQVSHGLTYQKLGKELMTQDELAVMDGGKCILFTPDTEKWETRQTGTVTTCGGSLNVRTGAGLDNDAFTQLPDGAQVEVIGTEGEWVKVLLPEREGYVHSDYLTITDTGSFSLSLDGTDLSALLELFASGLSGGGGAALTPDGNLSLIDDLGGTSSGKQFITVETKGGNVFYLIIDRDDEGAQTVHFLNQVDEADLLALMEDGEAQEAPAVCTCTEKCQAGAVNTSCEVCAVNMAECAGAEPEPEPEPEPEAEKSGGMGALALVLALVVLGGGAFAYIKFIRPKQASKVSADPDDYDFADEEEYINEDEPEPEEEMEDTK